MKRVNIHLPTDTYDELEKIVLSLDKHPVSKKLNCKYSKARIIRFALEYTFNFLPTEKGMFRFLTTQALKEIGTIK